MFPEVYEKMFVNSKVSFKELVFQKKENILKTVE